MSTVGLLTLLWFLVLAAPVKSCGPRSGFKMKNTVPPLPTLKLDENIQGMDVRVRWTSEVSFNLILDKFS